MAGWPVMRARVHRELHPVADGGVLGLAHAPDVACGHLVLGEHGAIRASTRTVPAAAISKVLSCEPYSSAACAMSPMLLTLPMVCTS